MGVWFVGGRGSRRMLFDVWRHKVGVWFVGGCGSRGMFDLWRHKVGCGL